jgi:hypothetical protein
LCLRPDESGVAQPAYATPECDSIVELVAAERAGDQVLARLAIRAEESAISEGPPAALAVSRAEAAQWESYLVASAIAPERYLRLRFRRLKITGASPGLSELATFVRVGATEQVLRLAESSVEVPVDHRSSTCPVDAVRAQRAYLAAARRIRCRPEDDIILDAWQAALDRHEDSQDPAPGSSDRESPGALAGVILAVSATMADLSHAGSLIATAAQIETAVDLPPQTTRARLRGAVHQDRQRSPAGLHARLGSSQTQ